MIKEEVTIAIPVYNGSEFILDALNSILGQTKKVDLILICDNLSTDDTVDKVNLFIRNNRDFNIELIENKSNIGFQRNFIKCYEQAKTKYLIILHADDILKPNTVENQLSYFKMNNSVAAVGGRADTIGRSGEFKNINSPKNDLIFKCDQIYEFIKSTSSYIPFSSVMYNKELTKDVSFFEDFSVGPDELYWPKLLKKHGIIVSGKSFINNRIYEGQMHIANSENKFLEYVDHFNLKIKNSELEDRKEFKEKTIKIIKKQVSKMSIRIGRDLCRYRKNYRTGYKYWSYGISLNYSVIFSKFYVKSALRSFNIIK